MTSFMTGALMGGLAGYAAGLVHAWFIAGGSRRQVARRRHPSRDVSHAPWLAPDDPRRTRRIP